MLLHCIERTKKLEDTTPLFPEVAFMDLCCADDNPLDFNPHMLVVSILSTTPVYDQLVVPHILVYPRILISDQSALQEMVPRKVEAPTPIFPSSTLRRSGRSSKPPICMKDFVTPATKHTTEAQTYLYPLSAVIDYHSLSSKYHSFLTRFSVDV